MKIAIREKLREVLPGDFNYGNIESSYGVNTLYFTKNGKPYTVIAGEMHFSRVPSYRWRENLLKMRECGINTVSTYVFWNHHEEKKGQLDFSGNRDIGRFLGICKDIAMPCILRIGPWCHGEAVYGGFPRRINAMLGNRSSSKAYLKQVEDFWRELYRRVSPYLDGETVIGIQLENEYTGSNSHLRDLKEIAVRVGFKAPFFTMTAWPSGVADRELLPLVGGYPDAPWTGGTAPLTPNHRFAITPIRGETDIGADTLENAAEVEGTYDYVPYASCETGPGVQPTQHRRPNIDEKAGYAVCFAKLASGVNWLGYYMFCGGANPVGRLLQESRLTGYPNDYPIIDYDFQAPLSRYGVCRPHGDRLRLMHLFISSFDSEICTKQTYFPQWKSLDPGDKSFPKCSIRADGEGSGYFFVSTYERNMTYDDFKNVEVELQTKNGKISLPPVDIKSGAMFFYPFNCKIGKVKFDYILAQPIAKIETEGKTVCYFTTCEGVEPTFSLDGKIAPIPENDEGIRVGDVQIIVLPLEKAKSFHLIDGKVYFLKGTVYRDNGKILREITTDKDIKDEISLTPCKRKNLPRNYFIYSTGERAYYELRLPEDILEDKFDICLEFDFEGLNLQVFSGDTLINDYFNINGKFLMNLRDYREYIAQSPVMTIRTAPKTAHGVSNVYMEVPLPLNSTKLTLASAKIIELTQV